MCLCVAAAVVIERVGLSEVTVAVDGSLYRFHPHFKQLMSNKLAQLLPPNLKVIFPARVGLPLQRSSLYQQ